METLATSMTEQLAAAFARDLTLPEPVLRMCDSLLMDLTGICVAARRLVVYSQQATNRYFVT